MNALPLVAFVGALYGISRFSSKVTAARAFQYDIADWPKVSYQGGQVILDIPLIIINTSRESFDNRKVFGQMFVNAQPVGDFISASRVVISAIGRSVVPVTVSAYLTNAVSSLISALITKSGGTAFTLRGTAVTSMADLPFVKDFKL